MRILNKQTFEGMRKQGNRKDKNLSFYKGWGFK